jgi:hypothetical protein
MMRSSRRVSDDTQALRLPIELWPWVVEACKREGLSHGELVAIAQVARPDINSNAAVRTFLAEYFADSQIGAVSCAPHEALGSRLAFGLVRIQFGRCLGWAVEWRTNGKPPRARGFFATKAEAQMHVDILTDLEDERQMLSRAEPETKMN